ncbi:hypothetical protein [Natronogracilivirga saccharolytica]|uniref:Uncharacterized protein n=1 Tax=Natronogracilivirga saccharolytica TaxID=2812953 RepID=A0A8J7RG71_9BACT|nr:hypothetical protein [Natronogracilivirga saccharolytica]MBP3191305.1 hypothetical protein [Natronogracilivirga saccharolytica]
MPHYTRILGIILILIGIIGYIASGAVSITAMIPAFFGIAFIILGRLAQKEAWRKHVMHIALLVALIGLFGSFSGIFDVISWLGGNQEVNELAAIARALMALLLIGYIALGVKSFIDARKAAS